MDRGGATACGTTAAPAGLERVVFATEDGRVLAGVLSSVRTEFKLGQYGYDRLINRCSSPLPTPPPFLSQSLHGSPYVLPRAHPRTSSDDPAEYTPRLIGAPHTLGAAPPRRQSPSPLISSSDCQITESSSNETAKSSPPFTTSRFSPTGTMASST